MSTRFKAVVGLSAVVIAVLGGLAWYLGIFASEEEAASVSQVAAILQNETGDQTASEEPLSDLTGTWQVQPSDATFVGYRVKEVLASVGDFTAVGRTAEVSGTLVAEGLTIRSVSVAADLSALRSNSRGRDNQLRQQGLETDTFPDASFELTSPIDIGSIPTAGEVFTTTAVGDLTVHGETQSVEVSIDSTVEGDRLVVVGRMDIVMSDFGITPPSAPVVASIEDQGIMEFSLVFGR